MQIDDDQIADRIQLMLAHRDAAASLCPSDVARQLAPESESAWRVLMPRIRAVAVKLALQSVVKITRGETVLEPSSIEGGPIRIRRGVRFSRDDS